jgi:hypothetical protein
MHRILHAGAMGFGLAMISTLAAGPANAAEPDGWLYFVNAAAHPMTLVVDGDHTELAARTRVAQPLSAGGHGLAAVIGGRTASQYLAFDLGAAGRDRGRAYWCYLGSEARGVPELIALPPADCIALIRAGHDDEPQHAAAAVSTSTNAR